MRSLIDEFEPTRRRLLGRPRAIALACLLGLLGSFSVAAPAAAWTAGTYDASQESVVFSLTNQARASAGLASLRYDSYLVGVARWRSKDMIVRDYFSHNIPPTGEMVFSKMQRDGYCFQVAGENIGGSSSPDDLAGSRLQNAWMNSPTHRANILGQWTNMGVGTYKRADGYKMYTVLFARACGATPKPAPVATPKPTPKPTPRPTVRPAPVATPRPVTPAPLVTATPAATPSATASATATPSATPTATATASPPPTEPAVTAPPAASPDETAVASTEPSPGGGATESLVTLRVREPERSDGLFDGLLHLLLGGVLGS